MLTTELEWVEERFLEIVGGLGDTVPMRAKLDPWGEDGPSREEDIEPWDDEDGLGDGGVDWP